MAQERKEVQAGGEDIIHISSNQKTSGGVFNSPDTFPATPPNQGKKFLSTPGSRWTSEVMSPGGRCGD